MDISNGTLVARRNTLQGLVVSEEGHAWDDMALHILVCGTRKLVVLLVGDRLWVLSLKTLDLLYAVGEVDGAHFGRFG